MLMIIKEFALGVNENDVTEIEKKLNEFNVHILNGPRYSGIEIDGKTFVKGYFTCSAMEQNLEKLTTYLQNDYKGVAIIRFKNGLGF